MLLYYFKVVDFFLLQDIQIVDRSGPSASGLFTPRPPASGSLIAHPTIPGWGYTREVATRPNRIPENAFIASARSTEMPWFSSGVDFSRLSNFPKEVEPAISGRINPFKTGQGEAILSRNCHGRNQKRKLF
jgi:hypothetical protein